jgi:hypothetical protein
MEWEWLSSDYFDDHASTFPQRFGRYTAPNGGEVDIMHINSLSRVDNGDYIVSARHFDTVFRVSRTDKSVRWTLGGNDSIALINAAPRLSIVGDPLGGPRRQHDARLSGDVLTMFDNRTAMGQPSRAVAYRIDEVNMTATMLWELRETSGLTSGALGSVRRAADGSTLIGWGLMNDSRSVLFEEIGVAGERLMAITQVDPTNGLPSGSSYRIVKYPPSDFSIDELRSKSGGAAEAPPAGP